MLKVSYLFIICLFNIFTHPSFAGDYVMEKICGKFHVEGPKHIRFTSDHPRKIYDLFPTAREFKRVLPYAQEELAVCIWKYRLYVPGYPGGPTRLMVTDATTIDFQGSEIGESVSKNSTSKPPKNQATEPVSRNSTNERRNSGYEDRRTQYQKDVIKRKQEIVDGTKYPLTKKIAQDSLNNYKKKTAPNKHTH